jgi:small conductance mechanosensitive channel
VVEDVTVRITRLRDMDGKLHTVRNGSPDVVANQTFEYANVNLDFSVTLDSDVDKVEKILNEVGAELATDVKWKELIVEPIRFLRVEAFEESTMKIKALGRVEPSLQWDVAGEFRRRLKKAFDKNHISLS